MSAEFFGLDAYMHSASGSWKGREFDRHLHFVVRHGVGVSGQDLHHRLGRQLERLRALLDDGRQRPVGLIKKIYFL
jgi:hypothetical protein